MGSWLNKCLWTFLEALNWVSVMYIAAHGVGSLPFHDHRTWQVEAHPRQGEKTSQLCDRVVWHKGPRYGFMGGQNLEGDGHRSLWCPCSGDGGTPLDRSVIPWPNGSKPTPRSCMGLLFGSSFWGQTTQVLCTPQDLRVGRVVAIYRRRSWDTWSGMFTCTCTRPLKCGWSQVWEEERHIGQSLDPVPP